MKRKSLSKRVRFEVLKRDKFTCQYCGAKAPDVLLEVDHIHPVAKDGDNDILNLIAACASCNSGKSDKTLSDSSALQKKHGQMSDLQERKEQIEMMAAWQSSLIDLEAEQLACAHETIQRLMPGRVLSEASLVELRKHLKKYGMDVVLSQFRASFGQHVVASTSDKYVESIGRAVVHAMSALKWKAQNERDPVGAKARYVRAIVRNRCAYVNERFAFNYVANALDAGADYEDLLEMAKRTTSWNCWENDIVDLITELRKEPR